MSTDLVQGGNAPVASQRVTVAISTQPAQPPGMDLDVSAFLLAGDGKVRSDDDMIFYNQPKSIDGSVVRAVQGGETLFSADLSRLPGAIQKIAFTVTIDGGEKKGQALGQLQQLTARVLDSDSQAELIRFAFPAGGAKEVAMTLAELYLRNGQWKFRAVAQGFAGGLGPLATSFGVVVEDEPPAPSAAPPPPPPSPAPSPTVSLSKVTLEKRGQSVSLEKKGGGSLGRIRVNLNWSRAPQKSGFFNRNKGVDLDLGAFVELKDGYRTAIQALGNRYGSFHSEPFIELAGDDRTGAVSSGEDMFINGDRWNDVRRVLIFAFIYEGAPNWQATDGAVTIHAAGEPPLEVRLDEGRNDRGMCAIASIENDGGNFKVTKLAEYFRDHKEMDERYGWGFRWVAGSKD